MVPPPPSSTEALPHYPSINLRGTASAVLVGTWASKMRPRSDRVTSLALAHWNPCSPPYPLLQPAGPPWSTCPVLRHRRQTRWHFQTSVVCAVETMLARSLLACCPIHSRTGLKGAQAVMVVAARAPRETLDQAELSRCLRVPTWRRSAWQWEAR